MGSSDESVSVVLVDFVEVGFDLAFLELDLECHGDVDGGGCGGGAKVCSLNVFAHCSLENTGGGAFGSSMLAGFCASAVALGAENIGRPWRESGEPLLDRVAVSTFGAPK
jgi:hypothetical protein